MKNKLTRQEMMQQSRIKILTIATDLFMSQGYLATSTREIAKAAELTQPSLYHHFKDKQTLYVEVVRQLTHNVKEDLDQIMDQEKDSETIFREMIMALIISHPTNIFMMVNDIMTEMSEEHRKLMLVLWQETYLDRFSRLIEIAMHQDEKLRVEDKNAASRYILSAISPLFNLKQNQMPHVALEAIVNQTVHFILYGIFR